MAAEYRKLDGEPGANDLWAGAQQRLGFAGAVASLTVSMLGTGIAAFPYGFSLCGLVVAPLALLLMGVFGHLSYVALIRCTSLAKVSLYSGLLPAVPKAWGHYANAASWLLLVLGATAYMLISADIVRSVVAQSGDVDQEDTWLLSNSVLFALMLLLVFPLCLPRSLAGLKPVSAYCTGAILACVGLLVWKSYCIIAAVPPLADAGLASEAALQEPATIVLAAQPSSIMLAVPILGCGMFGHMNLPQIYAELRPELKPVAWRVPLLACAAVVVLYMAVGLSGYLAFGAAASPDVVAQVAARSGEDGAVVAMQLLLASFIVLKTPLVLLPLRSLTLALVAPDTSLAELSAIRNAGLTAALLVCVYGALALLPDLGLTLQVSGALCVAPLCFVVPARLLWAMDASQPTALCIALGSFGVLTSALSFTALVA